MKCAALSRKVAVHRVPVVISTALGAVFNDQTVTPPVIPCRLPGATANHSDIILWNLVSRPRVEGRTTRK